MPADAKENLILASLMASFAVITAGATYLTSPTVELGPPPDPLPAIDPRPRIYLAYVRSDPGEPPRAGPIHYWRSRFVAFVVAKDQDTMNKVRKDLLVALYAGENALQSAYGQPAFPAEFTGPLGRTDIHIVGAHIGVQAIEIDYQTDHSAA